MRSALVHAAVSPLLVGLERLAYYGTFSVLFVYMSQELGMDSPRVSTLFGLFGLAFLASPLLGGGLAVLVGPHPPLVLGGLVLAAGYILLGLATSVGVWLPMGFLALGAGMVRPSVWAAAGRHIPSSHLRGALFVALYLAANLAALFSPLFGAISGGLFMSLVFWICAGLALGVAPLGGLLWWAERAWGADEASPETAPADPRPPWLAPAVALGVIAATAPFMALLSVGGQARWDGMMATGMSPGSFGGMEALDPVAVIVVSVLLCVSLVVAHFLEVRWPSLLLVGLAMVASSVSALALHPIVVSAGGMAPLFVGLVGLALADAVVSPLAMAAVTGPSLGRYAPLWVAGWLLVSGGTSRLAQVAASWLGTTWMLPAVAVAAGLLGTILLGAAVAGRRWLEPGPEGAAEIG